MTTIFNAGFGVCAKATPFMAKAEAKSNASVVRIKVNPVGGSRPYRRLGSKNTC
jgi:hypothetical protein